MGNRGRPSLKLSSEERLERRRMQLAESQRKCRARKRQIKKGGRAAAKETTTPELAPSTPESKYRDIEEWSMETASSGTNSCGASPSDTTSEDEAVSSVSTASNPIPDNQAPEAHSTAPEIEHTVLDGGSVTGSEPWSPELPWLLFPEDEVMSTMADSGQIHFWNQFSTNLVQTGETQELSPQNTGSLESSVGTWSPESSFDIESPSEISPLEGDVSSWKPNDSNCQKPLPMSDFQLFGTGALDSWESSFDWDSYSNNPAATEQSINNDWFANTEFPEYSFDMLGQIQAISGTSGPFGETVPQSISSQAETPFDFDWHEFSAIPDSPVADSEPRTT
ncbi:hypothetical protein HYFRA_00013454 [Hymenoscyphus fraxineus]|uniref:Uncharacterized protein n=1 Tax=Hymenoscyphus fraxineus TaxID=746836 RepID=A0A9N9L5Y0_9HELO|nr:hypothetical protein HYFRA_00013454 [Hymenoscyphus fraxineus]